MNTENAEETHTSAQHAVTEDAAAQTRRARFGTLPEPIPYAAMVEEVPVPKAVDGYDPERAWLYSSCVALDLGL